MKSRTAMTYAVSAATVATLVLAGCSGGDDDPTAGPTPTSASSSPTATSAAPSPSVTASPTASASASIDIPAAARANTDAGAIAFVRFWFEQLNIAYTLPDADLLPALSTSECTSCKNLAAEPERYVELGYKMHGPPTSPLTNVRIIGGAAADRRFIQFTLQQTSVEVHDRSGSVVDTQAAKSFERVAIVRREGNHWKLNGLADPS